jgi:hypothetical protein
MEGVKTWLSSQRQSFLTQAYKNLFPDTTSTLVIPVVTALRSSLSTYIPLTAAYFPNERRIIFRILWIVIIHHLNL